MTEISEIGGDGLPRRRASRWGGRRVLANRTAPPQSGVIRQIDTAAQASAGDEIALHAIMQSPSVASAGRRSSEKQLAATSGGAADMASTFRRATHRASWPRQAKS